MSVFSALNSRWIKIPAVATLSGLLLYQSYGLRHWDKTEITRLGSGTTFQHLVNKRMAGQSTGATPEAEHKLVAYSVANAAEHEGLFLPRMSAPGAEPVYMNVGVNMLLERMGYVVKVTGGPGTLAPSAIIATPHVTAPPADQNVGAMDAGAPDVQLFDEHVRLYKSQQTVETPPVTTTASPVDQAVVSTHGPERPDQHMQVNTRTGKVANQVTTPYITNLSAENLRFKTRYPYTGQTIVEIQEGDVKAFIPVGLHHDLKGGRARKTLDEMVKNGVVTERGVMATPYTDFGFKANRNEILQVPVNGSVVMHQPKGTSIRLSERYNTPEINRIVGDNVITESEKQQLGNKVVVFEVDGSNSYFLPVQVSPEAKMPPATSTKPTVTQLAPVESGYVRQAPAMRQVPVVSNAVERVTSQPAYVTNASLNAPQFRGRNALHNEMMYIPNTVVTRTGPVPNTVMPSAVTRIAPNVETGYTSTVTRMPSAVTTTPNVEVGYSTNSTVTRIESGFVGLRSSVRPGYGLLGTTYTPVLVQDAPTTPDWNKVVPVTRIPAYK